MRALSDLRHRGFVWGFCGSDRLPSLFLAYMVAAAAIFLLVMPLCLISLVNIALQ